MTSSLKWDAAQESVCDALVIEKRLYANAKERIRHQKSQSGLIDGLRVQMQMLLVKVVKNHPELTNITVKTPTWSSALWHIQNFNITGMNLLQ